MRLALFLITSIALWFFAPPGQAQPGPEWRVYKAADGLPQTYSSALTLGIRGQIIVRHPNVELMSKLDGYEIKTLPSPGLGSSPIYETSTEQYWSFTSEGLQHYANGAWVNYQIPEINDELISNKISFLHPIPLLPLKQNHVLIQLPSGIFDYGIEPNEKPTLARLRTSLESGLGQFTSLKTSREGGAWISGVQGLAKLPAPLKNLSPRSTWQIFLVPKEMGLVNLREPIEDNYGGIAAVADRAKSGETAIVYFDGATWSVKAVSTEKISFAWRTSEGFWAAGNNSLLRLDEHGLLINSNPELGGERYYDIALETNDVFYLATSEGVIRHCSTLWQTPKSCQNIHSAIEAFAEDLDHRLWAISADGLYLLTEPTNRFFSFPSKPFAPSADEYGLQALANGNLAITMDGALTEFEMETLRFKAPTQSDSSTLRVLGKFSDGLLCVRRFSDENDVAGKLQIYDGFRFKPFPVEQPPLDREPEISFFAAGSKGDLWLGGKNSILHFYEKKWHNLMDYGSSARKGADCFAEIGEDRFWFGQEDLLVEWNGKNSRLIQNGIDRIHAILKTKDGGVWLAANDGLHRYFRGAWLQNDMQEGLPSDSIRAVFEDSKSHLWVGTLHGASEYFPAADLDAPRTHVQPLPDPNNPISEGMPVNVLFSGVDRWKMTAPNQLQFSYRLDDREWSPYQFQKSTVFDNLPVGEHNFRVRCIDRNGNVDSPPALLKFTIATPWYRESRLIYLSSAGGLIILFFATLALNRHFRMVRSYAEIEAKVALRTQQLELANQELFHSQKMNALGTLAAGIAHDFNNILSIIKGSAQIIEDNLHNREKIKTRTDRIMTVVEQGSGIVKAMLGFSAGSEESLAPCAVNEIVKETIILLGDRFVREVEIKFRPAPDLPPVMASKEFIQQILLNFIFNAVEARKQNKQLILATQLAGSLPTSVRLKPAKASVYVLVSVQDFGSGIAAEILPRIFDPFFTTKALSVRRGTGLGLSMVYELAKRMECGLSVISTIGQGSTFILIIPVIPTAMDSTQKI